MRLQLVLRIALVSALSIGVGFGDDAAPTDGSVDVETDRAERASRDSQEFVTRYIIHATDDAPAELRTEPLLKWSNPAEGSVHGDVFLWTRAGRPFVAASMFQWFSPHTHRSHEFVSLAESPLAASYEGRAVWTTREPGIKFQPVNKSSPPAASAPLRLAQMRTLAREFSVTKRERDGQVQELRVLAQPVYRYGSVDSPPVVDGAIFVFVQGTDPEVWLLLEARQHADGTRWEFAAAPMNSVELTLQRGDEAVWQTAVRPWSDVYSHEETYTSFGKQDVPQPAVE